MHTSSRHPPGTLFSVLCIVKPLILTPPLQDEHHRHPHLFFYFLFWLCWVLVPVLGPSLVAVIAVVSRCRAQPPEQELRTCGAQASLLRGMWDLPRPGIEPTSAALAGGFSATGPPGESCHPRLMDKKAQAQRDWEVYPSSPSWLEWARVLTQSGPEPVLHASALKPQETDILGNCFVLKEIKENRNLLVMHPFLEAAGGRGTKRKKT